MQQLRDVIHSIIKEIRGGKEKQSKPLMPGYFQSEQFGQYLFSYWHLEKEGMLDLNTMFSEK
jgi:hypothetical protein